MRFSKIFSVFFFATLMIGFAAIGNAQTSAASEYKRRIMDQVIYGARKPAVDNARKSPAQGADVQKLGKYPKKNALLGTWDVVLTFSDGFEVRSTLQVAPGAAEGEGSCTHASEFSFTLPNPTLPEQGSWEHVKADDFIASYYGYSYTELLAPFGKIGFRHAISLSPNQQSFTGRAVFEVLDADGNVLFSDVLQTRGVRQRAVAP